MTARREALDHVRAHKVLNNNVVISIDESGRERILVGRGLGFRLKTGDEIDPDAVEKTFVLDDNADTEHVHRLLTDVPYPLVEAVTKAVEQAERDLGRSLGRHLLVGVIDHVQYLLQRLDQGLSVPSTGAPELAVLYPAEYAAATRMVTGIGSRLGRILPDGEAVFLTMHLLNVIRDEPNGTAAQLFRRVQHVVATVETGLGVALDHASHEYARFVLHVQFLLQRLVSRTMLVGSESTLLDAASRSYPKAREIASQVREYVRAGTGSELTEDELLYLIVHIERLRASTPETQSGPSKGPKDAST